MRESSIYSRKLLELGFNKILPITGQEVNGPIFLMFEMRGEKITLAADENGGVWGIKQYVNLAHLGFRDDSKLVASAITKLANED